MTYNIYNSFQESWNNRKEIVTMIIICDAQKVENTLLMCDGCDMVDDNGGCHGTDQ